MVAHYLRHAHASATRHDRLLHSEILTEMTRPARLAALMAEDEAHWRASACLVVARYAANETDLAALMNNKPHSANVRVAALLRARAPMPAPALSLQLATATAEGSSEEGAIPAGKRLLPARL